MADQNTARTAPVTEVAGLEEAKRVIREAWGEHEGDAGLNEDFVEAAARAALRVATQHQALDALLALPGAEESAAMEDLIAEGNRWPHVLENDPTPAAAPRDLIRRLTAALVDAAAVDRDVMRDSRIGEDSISDRDVMLEVLKPILHLPTDVVRDQLWAAGFRPFWNLRWEYSPGHIRPDGKPFIGSGVIAPGYVTHYLAERGDVLRRRVGEYEVVTSDTAPAPSEPDCCDGCRRAAGLGFTPSRLSPSR